MNEAAAVRGVEIGRRWTASDRVYEALERMVITGALKPGDRLTELGLAERLQVSRTPLRHALQRLVSKGWIRRSPNGAIHVVEVSEQEIEALYAVRSALEEMVLCQAAERMGAGDLEALRAILASQDQAAKAGKADLVSQHGEEFHRALWHLSGNPVGVQFLEEVLQRTTRYRRLSFSEPYRFREGSKQHWGIVKALAAGDLDAARRTIREHVEQSRNYVMQAFRSWRRDESPGAPAPARAAARKAGGTSKKPSGKAKRIG